MLWIIYSFLQFNLFILCPFHGQIKLSLFYCIDQFCSSEMFFKYMTHLLLIIYILIFLFISYRFIRDVYVYVQLWLYNNIVPNNVGLGLVAPICPNLSYCSVWFYVCPYHNGFYFNWFYFQKGVLIKHILYLKVK